MRLSPSYFFLNYTTECNSRCTTCDTWRSPRVTIPLENIRRMDRFLNPERLREIYFTGGEPLLPESCVDIAVELSRWCPGVALTGATNALEPELYMARVKAMQDAGVWINLMISLNGTPETHDRTRGVPGNYAKAMEFARGLQECGAFLGFNYLEIPEGRDLPPTTHEDIAHLRKVCADFGTQLWQSPIYRKSSWFGMEDDGIKMPRFSCHGCREVLAIRPNGDITACQEPRDDLILGNLRDEGLDAEHVQKIQRKIDAGGCQPCGCCTTAFSDGIRCVTRHQIERGKPEVRMPTLAQDRTGLYLTQLLTFEIGTECNRSCVHTRCPNGSPQRYSLLDTSRELDCETVVACAEAAYRKHNFRGLIAWHYYNEPTLYPDRIAEYTQAIKARVPGARFLLWTNGTATNWICDHFDLFDRVIQTGYPEKNPNAVLDARLDYPPAAGHAPCTVPYTEFILDAYGNHHICCYDWMGKASLGNVFSDGFDALVERFDAFRNSVGLDRTAAYAPEVCKTCSFRRNQIAVLDQDTAARTEVWRRGRTAPTTH